MYLHKIAVQKYNRNRKKYIVTAHNQTYHNLNQINIFKYQHERNIQKKKKHNSNITILFTNHNHDCNVWDATPRLSECMWYQDRKSKLYYWIFLNDKQRWFMSGGDLAHECMHEHSKHNSTHTNNNKNQQHLQRWNKDKIQRRTTIEQRQYTKQNNGNQLFWDNYLCLITLSTKQNNGNSLIH
jgi:hypothetical protein